MYRLLFSLVFSRMDPEDAHHFAFRVIRMLPTLGFGRLVEPFTRPDPSLAVEALGLRFPSPFGLAAGFDKDALAVQGLGQLGFGHVEVGTITAVAQPGNERPRLFRLIDDRALVNRMGFNNGGADAAVGRLSRLARRRHRPVLGVNIGKSRVTAVEDAVGDYERSARVLAPYADYLVVNVSSPNTPGLRGLQELDALAPLLEAVRAVAGDDAAAREDRTRPRRRGGGPHLRARHATRTRRDHRHEHHDLPRGTPGTGIRRRADRGRRPVGSSARRPLARGAAPGQGQRARRALRDLGRRRGDGGRRAGPPRRGCDARAGVLGVHLPRTGSGRAR